MKQILVVVVFLVTSAAMVNAQPAPSYSKDIRPFLAKYCLECHNAKTMKGSLSLETHKEAMDGSDAGRVIVPGKADQSKLVLLIEHKAKPVMPPVKAKFQPTKAEIALVRAWVLGGAKDDAADIKIVLPAIKTKVEVLPPPVSSLSYSVREKLLWITRGNRMGFVEFGKAKSRQAAGAFHEDSVFDSEVRVPMDTDWDHFVHVFNKQGTRGRLSVFSPRSSSEEIVLDLHQDVITDVAITAKGQIIATASYDTRIVIIRVAGKPQQQSLSEHSDAVYGLAFSPDGKLLASVSADRAMKVFDVEKGKLLYTLGHATDWLYAVAWSPDGKYLVSGGVDKSIRVYEPTPTGAKLRQSVFAHEGAVLKLVFTSDSKTLYSVGEDRVVKAWDIEKMVEGKVYDKQPETVLCLALREDAGQFIIGRYDGIVQLIDMKTGKVAHEFGEAEAKPKQGEKIEAPGKGGSLRRAGAVDVYRVEAKKGEQFAVRVTVTGKAKFEPVLTLADAKGRVLVESTDGLLGHTFAEAGVYQLSVRDREYRGGPDFVYQLQFGEIPIITAVFPTGIQRGTKADIQLDGVFLPRRTITVAAPADAKPGTMTPLDVGAGVLGKAQIVVGEFPEVTGGGKIPVPGTANGRILADNQNDLWTFSARKGQPLIVEVNARRLGSRLDSIIEILGLDDRPVPRAVLRAQAKTNVTFRDHDSAQGNIRIEAWSELGVNDFLFVGNELMKIKELPTHPDADCNFFAVDGKRLGYLDTTPTHHANGAPMYKVSLHPPGTTFGPNGYPVFTLYYKNDDGGPGYGRDSRIFFDPPTDGEYKVRIADARGMGGVNFGYRLTVRRPSPSFNVRFAPAAPVVSNFGAVPFTITVDRIDGCDDPIAIRFENLPPGISAPATTIEAGTFSTTVALYAQVLAPSAPSKLPMKVVGEAMIDGKKQTHEAVVPTLKFIEPGDIRTWTDESEVSLKAGAQAKLVVHIERAKGFTGRVPLDVKGLPHGVRVLDIGLNGILVNENETARTIVIYAEPWVQAQEHPFVVLARREGKGTEHAAKSVLLKVK
jgi:hypothetical protein